MGKLKPGKPSENELKYIADNCDAKQPEEIATVLNRTPEFVKRIISQMPRRQQIVEHSDFVEQLHASPLWLEIKKTLMCGEIAYFESQWAAYMSQFSSGTDVLATDEMMIKDLITLDIAFNRAAAEIVNARTLMDQVNKLLDKERDKSIEVRDQVAMQSWQDQVNALRNGLPALSKMQLDTQQRKDQKLDDLKATRKQRFTDLEQSKQNIFGLLRQLDESRNRHREGRLMEKVRIAALAVRNDLSQLTQYEDNTVDKPFISPEGELENE